MPKPSEETQEKRTGPTPEMTANTGPRPQPRWKEGAKPEDDEDELFNDMPV